MPMLSDMTFFKLTAGGEYCMIMHAIHWLDIATCIFGYYYVQLYPFMKETNWTTHLFKI